MRNNGISQPVGTGIQQPQGITKDDLTDEQKTEIQNFAGDINTRTSKMLPETYDVSTICRSTDQGVSIECVVFFTGQPVTNIQVLIQSINESDEHRTKQIKETSKTLVAQAAGQLIASNNNSNQIQGS